MAKKSSIERAKRVKSIVQSHGARRSALKAIVMSRSVDPAERFQAQLKLAALPRNGSSTRVRNRCAVTGRARGVYRKFQLSRIALREMASAGLLPGVRKASW